MAFLTFMIRKRAYYKNNIPRGSDVDFRILTALKGWVGHAPQGRGALHIII
jgi:hypothetical protein